MDWMKILKIVEKASKEMERVSEKEENIDFILDGDITPVENDIPEKEGVSEKEKVQGKKESQVKKEEVMDEIEHTFIICREQVEEKGEDFYLAQKNAEYLLLGVFDGCGGSGAKVYPQFDGQTGARVASRTLAEAVKEWFMNSEVKEKPEQNLQKMMERKLKECQKEVQSGQMLLGSLKKEFPSTMAAFLVPKEMNQADFFWCGDSRGYVLDDTGLHQVTLDDVPITDAMENLREDAPMTNVANASVPFTVHRKSAKLEKKSLILAATDGCFGYLPSPMEFEKFLLKTMAESENMQQWESELEKEIQKVTGDDFTLAIWSGMFADYQKMKENFHKRHMDVEQQYPLYEKVSEERLFQQWEEYKKSYESLWDVGETKDGN